MRVKFFYSIRCNTAVCHSYVTLTYLKQYNNTNPDKSRRPKDYVNTVYLWIFEARDKSPDEKWRKKRVICFHFTAFLIKSPQGMPRSSHKPEIANNAVGGLPTTSGQTQQWGRKAVLSHSGTNARAICDWITRELRPSRYRIQTNPRLVGPFVFLEFISFFGWLYSLLSTKQYTGIEYIVWIKYSIFTRRVRYREYRYSTIPVSRLYKLIYSVTVLLRAIGISMLVLLVPMGTKLKKVHGWN